MTDTAPATKGIPLQLTEPWGTINPPDGPSRTITVGERIVMSIRSGNPIQVSALAAGVTKETLHRYLRIGRRVQMGLDSGVSATEYTEAELAKAKFVADCAQAEAEFEVMAKNVMVAAGRGGQKITKRTVTKDRQGMVTESKEVTEELRPDWRAMDRVLQFRHPERYSPRLDVGVTEAQPDLEPTVDDLAAIALQSLEEWVEQEPIDADSTEVD